MDGLEHELGDRLRVVRLDLHSPPGRELAGRWGLRVTPTFVLFDAAGREAWRQTGGPDVGRVRAAVGADGPP